MKKFLAIAALLASGSALADTAADLRACKAVNDSLQRLVCYDKLAAQQPAADSVSAAVVTSAPAAAAAAAGSAEATAAAPALAVPPPAAAVPAPAAKETKPPETIQAHIVGEFKGWKLGTRFQLDNGQTWQVTQPGEARAKLTVNPAVTLNKSWIGYWMSVEGVSAKTKVTRVDD